MRRLICALLVTVAGLFAFGTAPGSAQTCGGPKVTADATSVRAGGSITVTGTGFDPACATGAGPHSPDVAISFVQGDTTTSLTTARARAGATSFEVRIEIPSSARAGTATITAQGAAGNATLPIQVTVSTPVAGATSTTTTAPATTPTTAAAGATEGATEGEIASTGIEAATLVGLAFALLLAGIVLEWIAQALPARI